MQAVEECCFPCGTSWISLPSENFHDLRIRRLQLLERDFKAIQILSRVNL